MTDLVPDIPWFLFPHWSSMQSPKEIAIDLDPIFLLVLLDSIETALKSDIEAPIIFLSG